MSRDVPDRRRAAHPALDAADVATLLARLSPRERRAVRLRYGLDGGGDRGWAEVGAAVGLGQARCRQAAAGWAGAYREGVG